MAEILKVPVLKNVITDRSIQKHKPKKEELKDGKIWKENLY